jgi:eukaryotic-like serine/threonine-protein kinase
VSAKPSWTDQAQWVDALLALPEQDRASWLAQQSIPAHSKRRLERLCEQWRDEPDDWLARGTAHWLESTQPILHTGAVFARFRLLEPLGEGGASVVWGAERLDAGAQRVAIKCLKSGLLDEVASRRFVNEQRMLARLRHPHIVQLIDSGVSEQGVPYIVMEWLTGKSIVQATCDLDLRARLRLWLDLADAVTYAHQNLVLHRDLKPSNVILTDQKQVKLLDFGISRAIAQDLRDTATLARTLTPAYAAPEQFGDGVPTTAIDVFGLGAVLSQMLTARAPFEGINRLRDPQRQALRPSLSPQHPQGVACALLRGDLDTVITKAMAIEPNARYASVAAFAQDIHQILARRPVAARAPTFWYTSARFVQRHRVMALSSALVSMLLIYAVIHVYQANVRTERLRLRAENSLAFVQSLFRNELRERPSADLPSTSELLESGAARAQIELANDPEGQARVLAWIASAFAQSDQHARAADYFAKASQLTSDPNDQLRWQLDQFDSALLSSKEPKTLWSQWRVLDASRQQMRTAHNVASDFDARLLSQKAALQVLDNQFAQAEQTMLTALAHLPRAQGAQGEAAQTTFLFTRLLKQTRLADQATRQTSAKAMQNAAAQTTLAQMRLQLSAIYTALGKHDRAADIAELASNNLSQINHASPRLRAQALSAWGTALAWNSDQRAEAKLREALAFSQSVSKTPNLPSADLANVLGNFLRNQARFDEARALLKLAHETRATLLGALHQETQDTFGDLIVLEYRAGKLRWAADAWRQQLKVMMESQQSTPAREGILRGNLADVLIELGELEAAETLARESLALRRASLGEFSTGPAYYLLWRIAEQRGQLDLGLSILQEGLAKLDPGNPRTSDHGLLLLCLANTERRLGQMPGARVHLNAAIALNTELLPVGHLRFGLMHLAEAAWFDANGQAGLARTALQQAAPTFESGVYLSRLRQAEYGAIAQKLGLQP